MNVNSEPPHHFHRFRIILESGDTIVYPHTNQEFYLLYTYILYIYVLYVFVYVYIHMIPLYMTIYDITIILFDIIISVQKNIQIDYMIIDMELQYAHVQIFRRLELGARGKSRTFPPMVSIHYTIKRHLDGKKHGDSAPEVIPPPNGVCLKVGSPKWHFNRYTDE